MGGVFKAAFECGFDDGFVLVADQVPGVLQSSFGQPLARYTFDHQSHKK
ncbi:hypothetical protein [Dyadobacter sp. CY323]|nr:hypothetical protein [Dyadobacter sp. CY323]MCE6991378.1 hypothetical protein [Dyadobacter sp. CY323]